MKKALIASSIFVAILLLLYFSKIQEKRLDNALTCFLSGDVTNAEDLLNDIEQSSSSFQGAFYKGFTSLLKEDFLTSMHFFQEALQFFHKDAQMHDLLLGKALCLYKQNAIEKMLPLCDMVADIDPKSFQLCFVRALYELKMENYPHFISFCKNRIEERKRNWVQGILDFYFPASWIDIHLAYAQIEQGEYTEARALLEKYFELPLLSLEMQEKVALYLALSHLKEASHLSFEEKKSYLKMALFYLERAGKGFENDPIASFFVDEFSKYFLEEKGFYTLSFFHILEKNEAHCALEYAADSTIKFLHGENSDLLCHAIIQDFSEKLFYKYLMGKLVSAFEKGLKEKSFEDALKIWNSLRIFSSKIPEDHRFIIAQILKEKIVDSLQKEDAELPQTLSYLTLLKMIDNSSDTSTSCFAYTIRNYGMLYWRKENEEKKGMNLLKISLQLAHEKTRELLEEDIRDFFSLLCTQAYEANMVERLSLIYDAFEEFNIEFKHFFSKDDLANYVADAAYFFNTQNYFSAKTHAAWVVKLDPLNEDAIRYVGLSSFHLGHYSEAIEYLKKLSHYDVEVEEVLTLCETYFAKEPIARVHIHKCLEIDCSQ